MIMRWANAPDPIHVPSNLEGIEHHFALAELPQNFSYDAAEGSTGGFGVTARRHGGS
jgi:hypothetical protein